jgi:hypothetical protein
MHAADFNVSVSGNDELGIILDTELFVVDLLVRPPCSSSCVLALVRHRVTVNERVHCRA